MSARTARQGPLVLDASVLLKWVLPPEREPGWAAALHIRDEWLEDRVDVLLPSLWIYEVGNILGLKQPKHAPEILAALVQYRMPEVQMTEALGRQAYALMARFRVTFYDAAYHALALDRAGVLVTADDTYVGKTKSAGSIARLTDWAS